MDLTTTTTTTTVVVNKEIDNAPFLVDSGTESYTESPIADEEIEESTTGSNSDENHHHHSSTTITTNSIQKSHCHILDKVVSVDEDTLTVPLEPIRTPLNPPARRHRGGGGDEFAVHIDEHLVTRHQITKTTDDDFYDDKNEQLQQKTTIPSILRRVSCYENEQSTIDPPTPPLLVLRKVSFPIEEIQLASYREPEYDFPWMISTRLTADKLLRIYQDSCKQHQTIQLDIINNLILDIKNNTNHSAILNLTMLNITREVNETLEDILKIANFRTLILNECKFTSETISEFLNMLEYYASVREIEVAMNFDDCEAWKYFCSACSNITILESISFRGMAINESYMRMLLNAINHNKAITVLKFDACILVKLPTFYLIENLITNTTLRELYLPSTGLYTKETECLGRFLQRNFHLKVLDISNNFIGDRGLEVLAKGLTKQNVPGYGLSVLVMFNNQITEKSGPIIKNIIVECKNLHTLNIGYNNLTDEVLLEIRDSLKATKSLEGLGLQCTLLTCKGINYLAEAIENNSSLQKINLRGNKAIQVAGLERLCQALTSSKISKIEIDETNRSSNDPQAYIQMVKRLNAICTVNKSFKDTNDDDDDDDDELTNISQMISRKVSLSCEPKYVIPETSLQIDTSSSSSSSRIISPAPKNRFQITKVQDNNNVVISPRPISRFKVTKVVTTTSSEAVSATGGGDDYSSTSSTSTNTASSTVTNAKFLNVRSSVSSNDSVDSLQLDMDID